MIKEAAGNSRSCPSCNKAVVDHEYNPGTKTYVLHDGAHVRVVKPGGNRTSKPQGKLAVPPSKRPDPVPGSRRNLKKRNQPEDRS